MICAVKLTETMIFSAVVRAAGAPAAELNEQGDGPDAEEDGAIGPLELPSEHFGEICDQQIKRV